MGRSRRGRVRLRDGGGGAPPHSRSHELEPGIRGHGPIAADHFTPNVTV